jgi:hypothetical protein
MKSAISNSCEQQSIKQQDLELNCDGILHQMQEFFCVAQKNVMKAVRTSPK